MSNEQESHMMTCKTMRDYFTYQPKSKRIKLEEFKIDERLFTYNEKKVNNQEYFYQRLFNKNKMMNETKINSFDDLRTTKELKRKPFFECELMKVDVKKRKHTENVMQNIIEYKEAMKKDFENKTVTSNQSVMSDEKIVISDVKIIKQKNIKEEQKKFKIIFPHQNEQEENTFPFFSEFIKEKDNFEMKADKVSKIKQEGKKKVCTKCNKCFRADYIERHKALHKNKFYFFQSNLSSIQINQIMSKKSPFQFYDFDQISNLDQIKRNKQIKHFAEVANQNNKILCLISRFQKKLSLHKSFWSFPKKPINFSNQANKQNYFSRIDCDMKTTLQINSLLSQNDLQKNPATLYNVLKLNLSQRTKLFTVFEYLQKIGTFRFVNFHVKTKPEHTNISKKRAKRNVQHLPNCLQIKKKLTLYLIILMN